MRNPWTKKNPFMSLWLSGANSVANRALGHAKAEATRQQGKLTKRATRLWTDTWLAAVTGKRHR